MKLYIEQFLIDNFIVNFIVFLLIGYTIKIKFNKYLMFLSSLLGGIFSLIYGVISLPMSLDFCYKFLIGIFMILILTKIKSFKQFAAIYLLFVTYTFVLGGVCYAILNIFSVEINKSNIFIYNLKIPLGMFISLIFIYVFLLIKLIAYLLKKNSLNQYYFDISILVNGKKYISKGFLDTGNELYDDNFQKGINVISLDLFCRLFKRFPMQKILLDSVTKNDIKNAHYVNCNTINSKEKMLVFEVEQIEILGKQKKICKNVLLGLSKRNFKNFDCLLNIEIVN